MATKRKTTTEDPAKVVRKLVDKIRKELSCTQAEAYFTLRSFVDPPEDVYFDPGPEVENNPPQPTLEWATAHTRSILEALNEYREEAEKGQVTGLFDSIDLCGELGFPLPEWAHARFEAAWNNFRFHVAKDLSEAFGADRPGKYHHDTACEKANRSFAIYWRCRKLAKEGAAIDIGLFERVAKENKKYFKDLKAGKVRDYYYAWKDRFEASHSELKGRDLNPFVVGAGPSPIPRQNRHRGRPRGTKGGNLKSKE